MHPEPIPIFPEIPWLPDQLRAATIKYAWAASHITKLNDLLAAFNDGSPWAPEQIPDLPAGSVRIRIHRQPPIEIGLVVGDIVHSLRGALDYATCALVRIADAAADLRKVQFPFGKDGKPLNSAERAPLRCLGAIAIPYIEEARRHGGPYLDVLNRVSNQDKHRLILPTMLRRLPVKFEIDHQKNTAELVIDQENFELWRNPISDGDIIEMGNMLACRNLRTGNSRTCGDDVRQSYPENQP